MRKGKKAAIWILCVLIAAIIALAAVFYQVPLSYDKGKITPITSNVQLLSASDPLNKSGSPALAKIENGKISDEDFRILMLTDVHLCELKTLSTRTIDRMISYVQTVKPDLIILGGDTLNGLNDEVRVRGFRELMDAFGVYWAPVLGNHEGDRPFLMTKREKIVRIWSESPLCLMESDTKKTSSGETVTGYGNYAVSVLGADGYVKDAFFFLDNGSKLMKKEEYEKWGVSKKADTAISASQVTWYEETYAKMKDANGGELTHMCVIHKPLQELAAAIELPADVTYGKALDWSFTEEAAAAGWEHVDGTLRDKIHCPPYTDGKLFDALVRNGAKAVFYGHDHVSDLTVLYRPADLYLTYIRLTTVGENLPEAEGYNVLSVKSAGGYAYAAFDPKGKKIADLFER